MEAEISTLRLRVLELEASQGQGFSQQDSQDLMEKDAQLQALKTTQKILAQDNQDLQDQLAKALAKGSN